MPASASTLTLRFPGDTEIVAKRFALRLCSTVLDDMLAQDPDVEALTLDDSPDAWREMLPYLTPSLSYPALTWTSVARMLPVADKYHIAHLLEGCLHFLTGVGELSRDKDSPNYVLHWLAVCESLNLDAFRAKCVRFIREQTGHVAMFRCCKCGARSPVPKGASVSASLLPRAAPAPAGARLGGSVRAMSAASLSATDRAPHLGVSATLSEADAHTELLCSSCGNCIACGLEYSNYQVLATPQRSCACVNPQVVLVPENQVLQDKEALSRLSREALLELLSAT